MKRSILGMVRLGCTGHGHKSDVPPELNGCGRNGYRFDK
jgi:hypothetical protein